MLHAEDYSVNLIQVCLQKGKQETSYKTLIQEASGKDS